MSTLAAPSKLRLPSSLRISATNSTVVRILSRLSRSSLTSLVLDWLDEGNAAVTQPYLVALAEDEDGDGAFVDDFYPPAHSLEQLREIYLALQKQRGSKREVIDRVVQGDWRHGLTLYQLAMADFQYFSDHPTTQKWMAHRILPLKSLDTSNPEADVLRVDRQSLAIPRVHPSTFLEKLQGQVLPDAKAHFQFDHRRGQPFLLLRIFILDSPYAAIMPSTASKTGHGPSEFDSARTMYVAFPDGAPFIYLSKTQSFGSLSTADTKSLQNLIYTGVRRALSRPRERFTVLSTTLTTRNLTTLLHVRGAGRTNSAGGGWGVYTERGQGDMPLQLDVTRPPLQATRSDGSRMDGAVGPGDNGNKAKRRRDGDTTPHVTHQSKRAKLVAKARFGTSGIVTDGLGLERVDVTLVDAYPEQSDHQQLRSEGWVPKIRLTFQGQHVFGGLRQLVERGVIDGGGMPSWLTGEDHMTAGVVKNGRMKMQRPS